MYDLCDLPNFLSLVIVAVSILEMLLGSEDVEFELGLYLFPLLSFWGLPNADIVTNGLDQIRNIPYINKIVAFLK